MKKPCIKCKEEKDLEEFYRHKKMADGRLNKCKDCTKADVRKNREEKSEYYREYDKRRYQDDPKVRERHRRYQSTDAGKDSVARSREKWLGSNSGKRACHVIVGNAVRDGRLIKKQECEECGCKEGRIHGHHDDYAKPLEVRWLCPACHRSWHVKNGEGANAH